MRDASSGIAQPLDRRYRRVGPPRVRERSEVPLQARPRAREVLRPRRLVGTPLRCQHSQGWRLLRVQGPRGRLHGYGPSSRMDDRDGKDAEQTFALALIDAARERGFKVRTAIVDKGYDSDEIHSGCMDRGIAPVTAFRGIERVKRGENKRPGCRRGVWTFAGADFKRRANEVAVSDRRMLACVRVGQGGSTASLDPARVGAFADALPLAWCHRARVRTPQARVGHSSRCGFADWIGSGSTPT